MTVAGPMQRPVALLRHKCFLPARPHLPGRSCHQPFLLASLPFHRKCVRRQCIARAKQANETTGSGSGGTTQAPAHTSPANDVSSVAAAGAEYAAGVSEVSLNHQDGAPTAASISPPRVEVPNMRIITDPEYLRLLGDGMPIIRGVDWPDVFETYNGDIASNRPVALPFPHPKFTEEDLVRIKQEGPRFEDLVLEHAELTHGGGKIPEKGEEYLRRLQMMFATDALDKQGEQPSNHLFENMLWDEFYKRDPWRYGIEDVERDYEDIFVNQEGDAEFIRTWEFKGDKYLAWRRKIDAWLEEQFDVPKFAEAYSYVPRTVMGDYTFNTEPNWVRLPQVPFMQFYQGLRERNWTNKYFKEDAEPWRVQFYQCDYEYVTGWPGWRAMVTTSNGSQFWCDMPAPGNETFLKDYNSGGTDSAIWRLRRAPTELAHPADYGSNQVFEQLFQAYERRLPDDSYMEFLQTSALPTRVNSYDCPADTLLDVSWHRTGIYVRNPIVHFLMEPTWGTFTGLFNGFVWTPDRFMVPLLSPVIGIVVEVLVALGVMLFMIAVIRYGIVSQQKKGMVAPSDTQAFSEDMDAGLIFSRSKATARKEGVTEVGFSDVAGLDPILGELLDVVEFLKAPGSFNKLGARPPKGILLEGDPGTGKTLLAKSIAGEALAPFFQMSGSEFVEGIIGVGAARIRDLFKRARAAAPCVIFVDELDGLGIKRADQTTSANEEREQTLNQLLTEMDGFTPDVGVVLIGATNRADLLDPALLRPGRFDRKIRMPKPDTEGRCQILKVHLRGKAVGDDVDLMQIARDLPGLVGADLAAVVNEASIEALKQDHDAISQKDLYAGIDRLTQGAVLPPLPPNPLVLQMFATKEVGTALVGWVLRQKNGFIEPLERVSIQPRGITMSRCMFMRNPDEEYMFMTRGRMLDRIKVVLAAEAAIRVVTGEGSNFGIHGIQRATRMAEKLVLWYGISDFGIPMFTFEPIRADDMGRGQRKKKLITVEDMDAYADFPSSDDFKFRFEPWNPSDVTWHRYQDEVRRILKTCWEDAWNICEQHRDSLQAGVKLLIRERELLGGELTAAFEAHPAITPDYTYTSEMKIWADGRHAEWPYGIEFLDDAYPKPYWVKERERQLKEAKAKKAEGEPAGVGA